MDNHNVRELGRICVCLLYVCHCCVCVSLMYASLSSHSCKTNPCIASGSDDLAGREFWARIKSKSSCSYLRSRETFSKTRSTVILHWQCSNELTVQNCFFLTEARIKSKSSCSLMTLPKHQLMMMIAIIGTPEKQCSNCGWNSLVFFLPSFT